MTRQHLIECITLRLHALSDRQLHKIYIFVCGFYPAE